MRLTTSSFRWGQLVRGNITRPMALYGTGTQLLRMAVSLIQKLCRNPLDPIRKRAETSSLTYHQLMASLPIPVARVVAGSIRSPRNNEKSRDGKYPAAAVHRIGAPGGTRPAGTGRPFQPRSFRKRNTTIRNKHALPRLFPCAFICRALTRRKSRHALGNAFEFSPSRYGMHLKGWIPRPRVHHAILRNDRASCGPFSPLPENLPRQVSKDTFGRS